MNKIFVAMSLAMVGLYLGGCGDYPVYQLSAASLDPIQDEQQRIDVAAQYSLEHDHAALIIYKDGQTVHETYAAGAGPSVSHAIFSGSKSFSCAMAVQARTDGIISSFDEVVSDTIIEWKIDSRKAGITIRQLLNFTSGISQDFAGFLLYPGNKHLYALWLPAIYNPGETFQYGEVHITIFAELMRRKLLAATGETPLAYLKRRVFDPIQLSYSSWVVDAAGNAMLSFGALLTAREWLKYGKLLKDNGEWNSVSVLNSALLSECFTGSPVMPAYGMSMWLNSPIEGDFRSLILLAGGRPTFELGTEKGLLYGDGPSDLVALAGFGDNRLYFSNSRNLVVVRLGRGNLFSNWKDASFLGRLLDGVRL